MRKILASLLVLLQFAAYSQTSLVKDIVSGTGSSYPYALKNINGTIYFGADDGTSGTELYKSNGTAAGTVRVADIYSGSGSGSPGAIVSLNNKAIFAADHPTLGRELYRSDGTVAGTVMIKDIVAGSLSSLPDNFTVIGSVVYFSVNKENSVELWKTDGSTIGTVLVKSLPSGSLTDFVNLNGVLYFVNVYSGELWKSNGTAAGTVIVKTINFSFIGELFPFNGRVYFQVQNTNDFTTKLWSTDGTSAGTTLVKNILLEKYGYAALGSYLYFVAKEVGSTNLELWRTNGTDAGTTRVTNINTSGDSFTDAYESSLTAFNGSLYFVATNGTERTLYKSNGTAAGTVKIVNAPTFTTDETALFHATDALYFTQGNALWRTNGTEAGTVKVRDFTAPVTEMANVGNVLYFTGSSAISGKELWKFVPPVAAARVISDEVATERSISIFPNSFSSSATVLVSDRELGNESLTVKILNLNGKVLKSYTINANEKFVIGAELPAGRFIAQILSGKKVINSKIIIKE